MQIPAGAGRKTEVALGEADQAAGSPICIFSSEAKVRSWLTAGGGTTFSYSPPRSWGLSMLWSGWSLACLSESEIGPQVTTELG